MNVSFALFAGCLLVAAPVLALEGDRAEPTLTFDFDHPPETTHQLSEAWSFGAVLDFDSIVEQNLDLDSSRNDDRATIEPRLDLAVAWEPTENLRAFTEVELRRGIVVRDEDDSLDPEAELRLEQAYVTFSEFRPGLSLQIGRQNFEDERDWWYDEELDAARLFFRSGSFGLEISAARNPAFGNDLLNRERTERSDNYFLVGRYAYTDYAELNAYVIAQKDGSDDREDPVFFGVRSIGEVSSRVEHWVDAAIVRGTDDGQDIRAHGFDAGLEYATGLAWQPSFMLGVALGSGDSNLDDDVDGDFRQTRLQGSYFYYGEVLAPELSNMWIATAGVGMEPLADLSVDVLYHRYRQHRAADELRDVLIDQDPDGRHRDLGQAVDMVAAWGGKRNFDVQLILGTFFPGDAFASEADNAFFGELIISYRF
jgi:alginate production protein